MNLEQIETASPVNFTPRHDWTLPEVQALFTQPLIDTVYQAQSVHRQHFDPNQVQLSTLLNIKTGGCPEDCGYCPQSARFHTGVDASGLLDVSAVKQAAATAREHGATRFCMGAAWRELRDRDLPRMAQMIGAVKELGMESCATLGMLTSEQAGQLKAAGLDYYNHNLDTSEGFYDQVINTRTYQDRLDTLGHVRQAGIHVCCGGILGLGEDLVDRCELLITLSGLPKHPESVPINVLVKVEGTPLAKADDVDPFDVIRTIAVARILMPQSYLRLSAGRAAMSDEQQALCFLAGANSIFYGEKLLTTENPEFSQDQALLARLGMHIKPFNGD